MMAKPARTTSKRQTAVQIITALAKLHDMTHPDGTVIQAEFARKTGISQSTLSRLLAGNEDWQLTRDSQLKLMETFGITQSEASGIKPISKVALKTKLAPTPHELELIRELRKLPSNDRKDIETLISLKSTLRGNE